MPTYPIEEDDDVRGSFEDECREIEDKKAGEDVFEVVAEGRAFRWLAGHLRESARGTAFTLPPCRGNVTADLDGLSTVGESWWSRLEDGSGGSDMTWGGVSAQQEGGEYGKGEWSGVVTKGWGLCLFDC